MGDWAPTEMRERTWKLHADRLRRERDLARKLFRECQAARDEMEAALRDIVELVGRNRERARQRAFSALGGASEGRLHLTPEEARVVDLALGQWAEEYATVEEAETAARVSGRLRGEGDG